VATGEACGGLPPPYSLWVVVQIADDGTRWWTYAGGRINQTLRHAIAEMTGWKVVNDNFRLRFEGDGVSHATVVKAIEALAVPSFWEDAGLWQRIVARIPPYRLSKFQAALPPRFELELVGRYLLDLDGARRFILGDTAEAPSARVADLLRRVISSFPVAEAGPQPLAVEVASPLRAIRLVTTDAELVALCADLATRQFIALDVETTLFDRDLCLIQVPARPSTSSRWRASSRGTCRPVCQVQRNPTSVAGLMRPLHRSRITTWQCFVGC
jgi:ATP-dependent helicase Lhr and Lhr-like helicase